jgi:uncharacterized membrane protein
MSTDGLRREPSRALTRALWAVVALLVAIGVAAAIGRAAFPADALTQADWMRQWSFAALGLIDPFAAGRPAELARIDGRFGANPFLIVLHVVAGGIFLVMAPLQFSSWMRANHIGIHRWSGRILLPALSISVAAGMYFGIVIPYAGLGEAIAIATFGGVFLISACRGYLAIRRGQVARHREWMIRMFASAIAISSVRLAGSFVDLALTPYGFAPTDLFVVSLWVGWLTTLGGAEAWIRYTRPRVSVTFASKITDGHQYRTVGKYPAAG